VAFSPTEYAEEIGFELLVLDHLGTRRRRVAEPTAIHDVQSSREHDRVAADNDVEDFPGERLSSARSAGKQAACLVEISLVNEYLSRP